MHAKLEKKYNCDSTQLHCPILIQPAVTKHTFVLTTASLTTKNDNGEYKT